MLNSVTFSRFRPIVIVMFVLAIANNKGGSGKTTIATHIAARYARIGKRTALADVDRQKSAMTWLKRRPRSVVSIQAVDLVKDGKIPKKAEILIVDGVASMRRELVQQVVKQADSLLIPVLPSAFDEDGTRRFLKPLGGIKQVQKNKRDIGFIANRVKLNTRSHLRVREFLSAWEYPIVAELRDTLQYANAAAEGLTLFDQHQTARVQTYSAEWEPIFAHIDRQL